ncbi:MAG: phosphoribosylamine--glycine ligase [Alicyclobacillus herbarius]|uniref:phosphoribosylamine--glycine ligase n=1 Tax=Alicyclobacillus herbarius TaxID=122960 RepID=UPI0023577ACD|nr:phosphoribosylamine--glycine ligase [Alicyclobacillus herbarius]MCL6632220.1 phosphoribosylamine--glycine ligase [Alicyclobacillus herbarius]
MAFEIPNKPRVLVVGSGAREHVLAWKLAQSPHRPELFAAPGNPGLAQVAECVPLAADDVDGLVSFCRTHAIELVVVGPEQPLSVGLVDALTQAGIRAFGPTEAAAQLETSKAFAKSLMQKAGVPTAAHRTFTDAKAAKAYIREQGAPIVVKADGLAAGKGVTVAKTVAEACRAVDEMMEGGRFGAAGRRVVVESFLAGREASLMFFIDESAVVPMIPARDHKRIGEGDTGPNTGGMGAYAPLPDADSRALAEEVERRIVRPTLAVLAEQGIQYRGVLYVGLMLTAEGPQVVEFNVRFGDPEAEVVLPLLASDLLEIAWAVSEGRLADIDIAWHSEQAAVCVVLAAAGYPDSPRKGDVIELPGAAGRPRAGVLDASANAETTSAGLVGASAGVSYTIFHAGTRQDGDTLKTAGGRVLTVTGVGKTLAEARDAAYAGADGVQFAGKYLRRDIARGL